MVIVLALFPNVVKRGHLATNLADHVIYECPQWNRSRDLILYMAEFLKKDEELLEAARRKTKPKVEDLPQPDADGKIERKYQAIKDLLDGDDYLVVHKSDVPLISYLMTVRGYKSAISSRENNCS